MAVPSMPVKRWNFRKAKWSHYIALTNKFAKTLLPPDSLDVDAAYQDFCNTIKKAAKKSIPRGYRNNYIPCWDAECKFLYKIFLQSPQGDNSSLAATALLTKLDRKRRERWSEAVRSIDFSNSSRLHRLKNDIPQVSVLASLLFNTYTYDLPSMIYRKFAYAHDLALLHSSGNRKDLEGTLSQEMSTLSAYLQNWRLKLSHTKTVTAAFHLNNREAKREQKVYNNDKL